jgi:peptidoglycan hydrolase-like protein with peptidoglycan-binding domain
MKKSFLTAATLAAALAGAPLALAQSGAQTGALGTGGSTSNQTQPANGANPGATMHGNSMQSGNMNSGQSSEEQQLSQSEIQSVQQHLQQQGYYKNAKVDGRWGPQTRQAVESFQQAKGLPATGQLDQQTLNALGVHQGG